MGAQHFTGRSHSKAFRNGFLRFASRNRFRHREPGMYLRDMDWQPEIFLEMGGRASVPSGFIIFILDKTEKSGTAQKPSLPE